MAPYRFLVQEDQRACLLLGWDAADWKIMTPLMEAMNETMQGLRGQDWDR